MKLENATVQLILKMAKQKPLFFIWTHLMMKSKKTYCQVSNLFETINEVLLIMKYCNFMTFTEFQQDVNQQTLSQSTESKEV